MSDQPENEAPPEKPKRFGKVGEANRKPFEIVRRPRAEAGDARPRESEGERRRAKFRRGERQAGTARGWSGDDRDRREGRDDRDDRGGHAKSFRDRRDFERGSRERRGDDRRHGDRRADRARSEFGGKRHGKDRDDGGHRRRGKSDQRHDQRRAGDLREPRPHRERGDDGRPRGPAKSRSPGADQLLRVAGLHAVESLFAVAPERIVRLFYTDEQRHHVGKIAKALAEARKPYRLVEADELEKIAGTEHHGGVVALAEPKPLPAFDAGAAAEWAKAGEPLLVLDGIGNPHNLGAVARTAAFFGVKRLLLSGHPAQAALSDAAYRVAQGGLDHLAVFRADDIARALTALKPHYRVIGTALEASQALADITRDDRPLALVLGNEEDGVPAATLAVCDEVVRIPGRGAVQSLNVAATAAILVWALMGR